MGYLFFQTWIWLLLAFIFGVVMGWIFRNMSCQNDAEHIEIHKDHNGNEISRKVIRK